MSEVPLYDSKRRPVVMGRRIASAGEGTIWEVADGRDLVAKVYLKPTILKAEKLRYMTHVCNDRLTSLAAWPTETLETSSGEIRGFLMPHIASAKDIHKLYGPGDRKKNFPEANWAFLIRAAANTARAFAVLHEQGHIVGDVNHGNLLVSAKATVALVDCDSFQVKSPQRTFLCEVGVPTHTPPELQEVNFASVARTKNHDAFGLAVLIFQLLFMGRHPFSGGFLGTGEMPIERAIKEFRFAYGDEARARQMQPPPHTLPLQAVSTNVAFLFERAFSQAGRDSGRPSANQWIAALEMLEKELRVCPANNRHHYYKSSAICPWCFIESKTGMVYFPPVFVTGATAFPPLVSIETLWKRIEAIPLRVAPLETVASAIPKPTTKFAEIASKRQNFFWKTLHFITIVSARQEAAARKGVAEKRLEELKQLWPLPELQKRFQESLRQFEEQRKAFQELDFVRQKKSDELNQQIRGQQLRRHLESCSIRAGVISGIGPAKEVALKSYGIDTAYDLTADRVLQVPGFGPYLATRLLNWRTSLEGQFRFDPSKGVDPHDVAALDSDIYAKKKRIIAYLENAPSTLRKIVEEMEREHLKLRTEIQQTAERRAQAEADLDSIS